MRVRLIPLLAVVLTTALTGAAVGAESSTGGGGVRTTTYPTGDQPGGAAQLAQSSACLSDPADDVINFDTGEEGSFPPADIVQVCAGYAADVTLTTRLVEATDPSSDPNWIEGFTSADWFLDLNADDLPEFWALLYHPDGVRLDVSTCGPGPNGWECSTANTACEGAAAWDADGYTATFPASCIGSPAGFRLQATMSYDTGSGHQDEAPDDGGWSTTVSQSDGAPDPGPAPGPQPGPGRETDRLAGPGRIETAVEISRYQFPDGASEVYLAVATNFPDALAGGALTRGPVLLVPSCGDLPTVVRDEIRRLNPARVVALGGSAVVCDAILSQASAA